jgi:hypothetical protein
MGGGAEIVMSAESASIQSLGAGVHVGEATEDKIVSMLNPPLAFQFRLAGQIVVRVIAVDIGDIVSALRSFAMKELVRKPKGNRVW